MSTLNGIKLIIWDLDETLWNGTLSEESVELDTGIYELISQTSDAGIVHSICSKNDYGQAKRKLEELDLWDYFVFPSIDWTPKGERIKGIITDMALRATNVLFLDDNIQNLKEAEYYCVDIKTATPDCIAELLDEAHSLEKTDKDHKRLAQYRVLEEKKEARTGFASNENFLMASNIRVEVHKDALNQIDRLHELLMRSNQLNYTKYRQSKNELKELLSDVNTESGYVTVSDRFGDYGIVGFYAIKNGTAIHYLFSCRTLGMLVEQWVYKTIGCPEIDVKGEVVTQLNSKDLPKWINHKKRIVSNEAKAQIEHHILLKGPCDLLQMFTFINETDNIVTEFTYTNENGVVVEGINHTAQILSAVEAEEDDKQKVLTDLPWSDKKMLESSWETGKYDIIFLSMVTDAAMSVYRHKETGILISLCERYYDLTKKEIWNDLIRGKIWNEDIPFTAENLKKFQDRFEHVNDDDFKLSITNIERLYQKLSHKTKLVLLLGTEKPYNKEKRPAYISRHKDHSRLNTLIRDWSKNKDNVFLYEMDDYISGQNDFVDSINHYSKKIYYELAKKIVEDIREYTTNDISVKQHSSVYSEELKSGIKRVARRIMKKQ